MKIIKSHNDVKKIIPDIQAQSIICLDTETNGLDPHNNEILLIQIGTFKEQYVIDCARTGSGVWELIHVINNPDIRKVMHNAKFDYSMIKGNFGIDLKNIACTLMGAQLLTKGIMGVDNSLAGCLDKYLGVKIDKEQQTSFIGMSYGSYFTDEQLIYSAFDVKHLLKLYKKLEKLLVDRGMGELAELEYETCRVCGDMEVNGVYIDQSRWLALREDAGKVADELKTKLDIALVGQGYPLDLFGVPMVNYNSPEQMLPAIRTITGVKRLKSTDATELEKIDHEFVKDFVAYKKARKLYTTYGLEFLKKHINPKTNRLHSTFKQLGTDSGRMSSSNPNLQNIPAKAAYRDPFRVEDEENYRMVCADFSGQELRLLAYISHEPKFIEALTNNMDLHSYSASLLFGIPYDDFFERDQNGNIIFNKGEPEVKKDMKIKYRNPCKSITFGLIYGMGPSKLANSLKITKEEAVELMDKYFATFPAIKITLDDLEAKARRDKQAYSPLDGRIRLFSGVDWDHPGKVAHLLNVAKNQPFQGAGASVTKLALCRMKHRIEENNWDAQLVLVIHDEIVVTCHKDIAELVASTLEIEMAAAFNYYAPTVPMPVKADIGLCWKK